ncbi:MAG: DUF4139 domain-containing protein [Phycisphaera sp.]|nr:DUF4139 domain-containing protein [Phycisphaera sp.]
MRVIALSIIGIGLCSSVFAQDAKQAAPPVTDLPVKRAVLFSSGVGYFEHAGKVDGDARLSIGFKTEQINDVLKSLVFADAGGGTVTTVSYPSNDPLERALRSFGIDLSDNPDMPTLLGQLRGARVTVLAPDKIDGSILTVQERTVAVGNPSVETTEYDLVLVTNTGIKTLPLKSIENIEFDDAKLTDELNKALTLLATARDTERKPVELDLRGKGERNVRVGYLVESPVWKTAYRLDLSPIADKQKPVLQGWAIVENTSDTDWKGITLSLVSGRPISFVMDLYTPLYATRPVVKPPLMASLMPRVYGEGIAMEDGRMQAAEAKAELDESLTVPGSRRMRGYSGGGRNGAALFGGMVSDAPAPSLDIAGSVQSAASAGSVGELFQYTMQQPIDLPRRRSAMIPIVNDGVEATKVSIYNPSVHTTHPLNGVWLTNSTNLKLLGGPVTVFDGSSYAGDAQIDHLAPGDKRLLSYAVDLAVIVDPSVKSSSNITSARVNKGVLYVSRRNVYDQTYSIKNKADADRKVIVEHPFDASRKLLEPAKYEEKTPDLYRFSVDVPAGKTVDLPVKEEQVTSQGYALLNYDLGQLLYYQRNGEIPGEVRKALEDVAARRQAIADTEQSLNQATKQLNDIKNGQQRLRENLKTVGNDSPLGKRYLAKLSSEEDDIERLEKQVEDLQNDLNAKREELSKFLGNLNVG